MKSKGYIGVFRRYEYVLIDMVPNDIDGMQMLEVTQVETAAGVKH